MFIFCVASLEVGDEIALGGLRSWIKERSSKLKFDVVVHQQKFMNYCKQCVAT
jgi:hypothetical protein